MMHRRHISTFISRLSVSLLLGLMALPSQAQLKMFRMEQDSVAFFRGFAVSFDLVGPAMLMLSDHGEYEGALRINLHDQWFPIFEAGIGRANHENDEVTEITYKTTAPYFRIGMDWNILNKKVHMNPKTWGSYAAEVENIRSFMKKRLAWMDTKLGYSYVPNAIVEARIDLSRSYQVFTLSGQPCGTSLDGLRPGIYVVRQGAAAKKIIVK